MMSRTALAVALVILAVSHHAAAHGLEKAVAAASIAAALHSPAPAPAPAPVPAPKPVSGVNPASVTATDPLGLANVTKVMEFKAALGVPGLDSHITASVVPAGCKSIYQVIKSNADKSPYFTFLERAFRVTGYKSFFDNPALVATFAAPVDAGFTAALGDIGVDAQTLFDDVVLLSEYILYHVVPGVQITQASILPDQLYDTLLVDSKGVVQNWQYKFATVTELVALGQGYNLSASTMDRNRIYPSGGTYAKITKFDVNIGCPSVLLYINYLLIPSYLDQTTVDSADIAIAANVALDQSGASERYRRQYPAAYRNAPQPKATAQQP